MEDVNDVGLDDGAEAVGDDDGGAVGAEFGERGLNEVLGFHIDSGGGFIEQQDGGVFEEGAGEGEALALAAAQEDAALTDFGVETFGNAADEVFGAGITQGGPEFVIGGTGVAEEEVVTHGSGEEKGFLSDISEGLAKGALVEVTQRDAIERDDAALRIVEAGE